MVLTDTIGVYPDWGLSEKKMNPVQKQKSGSMPKKQKQKQTLKA